MPHEGLTPEAKTKRRERERERDRPLPDSFRGGGDNSGPRLASSLPLSLQASRRRWQSADCPMGRRWPSTLALGQVTGGVVRRRCSSEEMEWRGDPGTRIGQGHESDEYIVLIKPCRFMCNETTPF